MYGFHFVQRKRQHAFFADFEEFFIRNRKDYFLKKGRDMRFADPRGAEFTRVELLPFFVGIDGNGLNELVGEDFIGYPFDLLSRKAPPDKILRCRMDRKIGGKVLA